MKKLFVAAALLMSMGTSGMFANIPNNTNITINAVMDDYTSIEMKDVPQAIKDTVAKNYEGNAIKEAYVKTDEDGNKTYKIVLIDAEETESVVLFNEKGEEVKETED